MKILDYLKFMSASCVLKYVIVSECMSICVCVCVDVAWRRILRYVELSHRFDCQPANEYVLGVRVADTILYESSQWYS